ncbi:hypothetical protein P262_p1029 (plasmid) [Cronobacter malonaticus]|uniref:Uncharacterized protein n=1 Tax=Cronobacter malonaticus TaxID=413503 RepID=V5U560_9ENTR|nr:hypothetical protein P262_p1029 [Cronobacter malonaticus]
MYFLNKKSLSNSYLYKVIFVIIFQMQLMSSILIFNPFIYITN